MNYLRRLLPPRVLGSSHILTRFKSTSSATHKFVVFVPDKTDEGAFQRRLAVRPAHLKVAERLIADGKIRIAGALLTPESVNSAEKKMIGSVLIYEAKSMEEVEKLVKEDLYYTEGVWDPEKLIILPFAPFTNIP